MDGWLKEATTTALQRISAHAEIVDLTNTDEATFRSFFMAALRERHPTARVETEWHKFDLLVQLRGRNTLIEFKYYLLRRTIELDGSKGHWKGCAGPKNEKEFWECIRKLRTCTRQPIHARYMVLVYGQANSGERKRSFHESYRALALDDLLAEVATIERDPLICKLIRVR